MIREEGWYDLFSLRSVVYDKYQGMSQKECKRLLTEEHDNILLYEELEDKFGELSDQEKQYSKNIFIKEVLSKLIFEGVSVWIDSNLKEHKKSIE